MEKIDLQNVDIRSLNQRLQGRVGDVSIQSFEVLHPMGRHAIAAGLNRPIEVQIRGHAGYYCAGMNEQASVSIDGNAGVGLAENMMSGVVRVKGDASQSAGATAHGGLLVIEGDASARCAISLKGADVVVGGSVGHLSAFMAQAGRLVVLGSAGADLGDSLYEAEIYVLGETSTLGADCERKQPSDQQLSSLGALLETAGFLADPREFKCFGSARRLYHFNVDHAGNY